MPDKVRYQAAGNSITGFRNAYTAEVNGKYIERCIRSAACHATHAADEGVGAILLHCINHQAIGAAAAQ